jgi:hypothetical protein
LKAYCLAFAFLLASLPALADELPPSSNAWRVTDNDLADPSNFHWTLLDDAAGGAQSPTAASEADAPARAALQQIRAQTARVLEEARRTSANVDRIRYDLHISCVVQQVSDNSDPLANASMPWIWRSSDADDDAAASGSVEMCQIDYKQQVRSQAQRAPEPQMRGYAVSFPVE